MELRKIVISKEELLSLYVGKLLTDDQIALRMGIHRLTVAKRRRECGIPTMNYMAREQLIAERDGTNYVDMRGRPVTESEWRRRKKISEAFKGRPSPTRGMKQSQEAKEKISEALRKRIRKPVSKEAKEKMRTAKLGRKLSDKHRLKIAEGNRGKHRHPVSEAMREHLSRKTKEFFAKMTKEERRKHVEKWNAAGKLASMNTKISSIEYMIRDVLEIERISFEPQRPIFEYFADIYVPSHRLVIECDGEYWHGSPEKKKRDALRDKRMTRAGYIVVRLQENDIRADAVRTLRNGLMGAGLSIRILKGGERDGKSVSV